MKMEHFNQFGFNSHIVQLNKLNTECDAAYKSLVKDSKIAYKKKVRRNKDALMLVQPIEIPNHVEENLKNNNKQLFNKLKERNLKKQQIEEKKKEKMKVKKFEVSREVKILTDNLEEIKRKRYEIEDSQRETDMLFSLKMNSPYLANKIMRDTIKNFKETEEIAKKKTLNKTKLFYDLKERNANNAFEKISAGLVKSSSTKSLRVGSNILKNLETIKKDVLSFQKDPNFAKITDFLKKSATKPTLEEKENLKTPSRALALHLEDNSDFKSKSANKLNKNVTKSFKLASPVSRNVLTGYNLMSTTICTDQNYVNYETNNFNLISDSFKRTTLFNLSPYRSPPPKYKTNHDSDKLSLSAKSQEDRLINSPISKKIQSPPSSLFKPKSNLRDGINSTLRKFKSKVKKINFEDQYQIRKPNEMSVREETKISSSPLKSILSHAKTTNNEQTSFKKKKSSKKQIKNNCGEYRTNYPFEHLDLGASEIHETTSEMRYLLYKTMTKSERNLPPGYLKYLYNIKLASDLRSKLIGIESILPKLIRKNIFEVVNDEVMRLKNPNINSKIYKQLEKNESQSFGKIPIINGSIDKKKVILRDIKPYEKQTLDEYLEINKRCLNLTSKLQNYKIFSEREIELRVQTVKDLAIKKLKNNYFVLRIVDKNSGLKMNSVIDNNLQ